MLFRKAEMNDLNQIDILINENLETNVKVFESGFVQNKYNRNNLENTFCCRG